MGRKHGNTLIGTLRKIYGQGFAAGYPATEKLSEAAILNRRLQCTSDVLVLTRGLRCPGPIQRRQALFCLVALSVLRMS
jgi:hypothetical protein